MSNELNQDKVIRKARMKDGYYSLELPAHWARFNLQSSPYLVLKVSNDEIIIRPLEVG